jgi:sugar phosphate isomerase/epimerase
MQHKKFTMKILATNWGFYGSVDAFCQRAKQEKYDGIEMWWPVSKQEQNDLFAALKKYQLDIGFTVAGHDSNFKKNLQSFKKMATAAATNTIQKPLYVNCHSGKDFFSFEENCRFIDFTTELSKQTDIKICHETHRSRILFAPSVAKMFLQHKPGLRITFDVSHWCNVSESLLHDQQDTLNLAIQRTDHIHARIGHPEGPQVTDPRAPEWKAVVNAHFEWWDKIVSLKKQQGEMITILTEFGPPDYMPVLPYTRQPVANQWEINVYMMQTLRKRYGA